MVSRVLGHGGTAAVESALRAEGKTLGDPADLRTMCRVLMSVGEKEDTLMKGLPFPS